MIRVKLTSVLVEDQQKAKAFYTETLGFALKREIPFGNGASWLTVTAADEPDGTELLLEPVHGVAEAVTFQKALFSAGIPITAFGVDDIHAEYARLTLLGVEFRGSPTKPASGPTTVALNDTCGNYIQLFQIDEAD